MPILRGHLTPLSHSANHVLRTYHKTLLTQRYGRYTIRVLFIENVKVIAEMERVLAHKVDTLRAACSRSKDRRRA